MNINYILCHIIFISQRRMTENTQKPIWTSKYSKTTTSTSVEDFNKIGDMIYKLGNRPEERRVKGQKRKYTYSELLHVAILLLEDKLYPLSNEKDRDRAHTYLAEKLEG